MGGLAVLGQVPLALPSNSSFTQTFANRGTTSGWDFILKEHLGTVSQVTNVVYGNSGSAIKMTQTTMPLQHYQGYHRGQQGFYGFAFRLQEAWQFSPAQSYNLAQFIADFTDTGCDDWMPSSMVWIIGNQLASRVKTGSVCDQSITEYKNLATVSEGKWHKIVIQANWQNDGTGWYKMWLDGKKVLEKYNIDTTIDDTREFQFHLGLYANGWHDDGEMKGTQPFRQVWYDQIGMGSTFADADPDQWS
ncbi:polysaccharide lyase-domain-containing protein [Roridomyces roridus]|uniref:Polysaccharide lyase-domain-containing protein n=1 Tax=Roridomyces roridus TaxID=1738132 RepID=A0AAD7F8W5_9AGAR|nr:polysaccharide lyase-domain-containing protein [Roridomyces roridus]